MKVTEDIRSLIYKHSKSYNKSSREDYMLHLVSCAALAVPREEDIMKVLRKQYRPSYIRRWLKRLKEYDR